ARDTRAEGRGRVRRRCSAPGVPRLARRRGRAVQPSPGHLYGARLLRTGRRRAGRTPGGQPGQPRAQPGGGLPHVLRGSGMMVWSGLAAIGIGRGDEDRGLTEQWLAAGLSRSRLILARSAAFALVLLIACLASTLGISAVAPLVGQDANLGGELGKAVSMTAGLLACFGLALLISQLPAERQTATALGIGALVLLLIVNGVADTISGASWLGAISPFHWLERTSSAAPGGVFDAWGTVGLAAAAAVLTGVTLPVFERRDIGRGLLTRLRRRAPAARDASQNPLLRTPFTEGLWEQRVGLAVWVAGTAVLGWLLVSVTKST